MARPPATAKPVRTRFADSRSYKRQQRRLRPGKPFGGVDELGFADGSELENRACEHQFRLAHRSSFVGRCVATCGWRQPSASCTKALRPSESNGHAHDGTGGCHGYQQASRCRRDVRSGRGIRWRSVDCRRGAPGEVPAHGDRRPLGVRRGDGSSGRTVWDVQGRVREQLDRTAPFFIAAGGLPPGLTVEQFIALIDANPTGTAAGRLRCRGRLCEAGVRTIRSFSI